MHTDPFETFLHDTRTAAVEALEGELGYYELRTPTGTQRTPAVVVLYVPDDVPPAIAQGGVELVLKPQLEIPVTLMMNESIRETFQITVEAVQHDTSKNCHRARLALMKKLRKFLQPPIIRTPRIEQLDNLEQVSLVVQRTFEIR